MVQIISDLMINKTGFKDIDKLCNDIMHTAIVVGRFDVKPQRKRVSYQWQESIFNCSIRSSILLTYFIVDFLANEKACLPTI
jgi:hypothetical protein